MELVLYYSTGDARMKKQEMMMKSVLVRMGVKIRNVAPDQVLESVGYLAGVPGFEKREVSETLETEEKLPEITEPMLVMRDFNKPQDRHPSFKPEKGKGAEDQFKSHCYRAECRLELLSSL